MIGPGIKRGTAELAVLSVLEDGPLHGYEMARRIDMRAVVHDHMHFGDVGAVFRNPADLPNVRLRK